MVAMALPRTAFLSPLDALGVLCNLVEEAQHSIERAIVAARVETLRGLVRVLEQDTFEAWQGKTPAEVDAVALELGRSHWIEWVNAIRFALDLTRRLGISAQDVATRGGAAWGEIARDADRHLPDLTAEARRRVRATAFLFAGVLENAQISGQELLRSLENPAQLPDDGLRVMGLLQSLAVASRLRGFPSGVPEALAASLWRAATQGVDPELIEDAYWAAEAAEVREHPEGFTPLGKTGVARE